MKKTAHFFIIFLFVALVAGCDVKDSNSTDALYIIIKNDVASITTEAPYYNLLSGTIEVSVSSDPSASEWDGYEGNQTVTLEEGEVSEPLRISNRFTVQVNGMDFKAGGFGISNPPRDTWLLKIISIQEPMEGSFYYGWDLSVVLD
ncbi:hypothetical protein QLX67_07150 [Balneolaceae bacterium ANBcel3]|nr:hypothetical protein [Balneolaceae bacterium ANBcel3]